MDCKKVRSIFEKSREADIVGEKEKETSRVKEKTDVFEKLMRSENGRVEKTIIEKKKRKRVKSVLRDSEKTENKKQKTEISVMENWVLRAVDNKEKTNRERKVINSRETGQSREQGLVRSEVNIKLVKNVKQKFENRTEKLTHFESKTSSVVGHSGEKVKEVDTKKI